jgi:hypothetical protein
MTTTEPTTTSSCCDTSCDYEPFARNNYWYGKLMLPQDFIDEQRYFRDKQRHHNQRLHGTGVVCGLLVQQDATPGCRDRIVDITPGTALDCCGNEILVRETVRFDLSTLPAVQALDTTTTHELRICLRYRECATEPVPVLYDECGCDDGRCLPNRILESFDVDVVVDPPATADTWQGPALVRDTDLGIAAAQHVRIVGDRVFVAAGSTLYQVDAQSRTTLMSHDLGGGIHALEPSADGANLFAVHDDASQAVTLTTLAAADLSVVNTGAVPSGTTPLAAAAGSDGRLVVLLGTGTLLHYAADITSAAPTVPATVAVPARRTLLALSGDAATAYVGAPSGSGAANPAQIDVVDLASETVGTPITSLPADPTLLVMAGNHLVVAASDDRCYAVDLPAGPVAGSAPLAGGPFAAAGSPWAYVLDASGGTSRVRPVHLTAVASGGSDVVGPIAAFAGDAHDIAVDTSGSHVYIAYTASGQEPGGVAVYEVQGGGSCRDGWNLLPTCPSCVEPDCVVLATIHGYQPGFIVLDPADPASVPADDLTNHIARIDNRADRHVLRSTELISHTVECLLDCCSGGGGGAQGPPGKDGKDGKDGTNGKDGKDGKDGTNGKDGKDGPPGPGLEDGLTRITAVSWRHAGTMLVSELATVVFDRGTPTERRVPALTIVFSAPVQTGTVEPVHVFQVEAPNPAFQAQGAQLGFVCRCSVAGEIVPVKPNLAPGTGAFVDADATPGAAAATGVAFVFNARFVDSVLSKRPLDDLWIKFRGDFVLDKSGHAVDAEFTRAEFPTGDRPSGSPYGIQGGLFESWFRPKRDG